MYQRRKFIRQMMMGSAGLCAAPFFTKADTALPQPYMVDDPYEGIDWSRILYVPSTSHVHVEGQSKLDAVYSKFGLRHIPISNYYPSAPYYPAEKIMQNQFIRQEFGIVYHPRDRAADKENKLDGEYLPGPINWNDLIMDPAKGWYNDLPEELKKRLPIKPGGRLFKTIPGDVIISPNAEHHGFSNVPLHACAVGSLYASGNFDVHNVFKTLDHGYSAGTGLPWEEVFAQMLDKLLFKTGGGITINHPVWSGLAYEDVLKMLDFDHRVMGMEVYNDTCVTNYGEPDRGWALRLWDEVLKTNRRCLGFFVPDHTLGRGKNVLLVSRFNERECLEAYRKGAFFGALSGQTLRFTHLSLSDKILNIQLNDRAYIRVVTNNGEAQKTNSKETSFKIPVDGDGLPTISYVRVEATDDSGEQIFSQPIRFLK